MWKLNLFGTNSNKNNNSTNDDWRLELEFVDEIEFRNLAKKYFELTVNAQEILTHTRWMESHTIDPKIRDLCIKNRSFGEKFRALVRPSEKLFGKWSNFDNFEVSNSDVRNATNNRGALETLAHNRDLLLRVLEAAADPKLVETRKKRELSIRGLSTKRIFVVHGHDAEARKAVSDFLKMLDFDPIVLHEQANLGKTVIEKFEANADVGFAVVLLTADDQVKSTVSTDQSITYRARQNVILELGYFIAKLGRDRVCALKKGDIELPSDILGVAYTKLDDAGGWKLELARELAAVGFTIDATKLLARAPV